MNSILIVEDSAELLDVLATMLSESYSVLTAGNGAEALAVLDQSHVDLILLDVMMPVMDGVTVVKQLRRRGDDTPVILLSAVGDLARWASELDVSDAFSKPCDIAALEASIARALREGPRHRGGPAAPPASPAGPGGAPPRGGGFGPRSHSAMPASL